MSRKKMGMAERAWKSLTYPIKAWTLCQAPIFWQIKNWSLISAPAKKMI